MVANRLDMLVCATRIKAFAAKNNMEWEVKQVNSRGLSWSTDWHSLRPRSSVRQMFDYNSPPARQDNRGISIYVCSSALESFIARVLPSVKRRFVLVCGDCDEDFPYQCATQQMFEFLLGHENLVHIFAQNCRINHPRITRMPIGLDYHTIRGAQLPADQEAVLHNIAERAPDLTKRKLLIYSTFQFANMRAARQEARRNLNRQLVYYEPTKVQRGLSWQRQTEYAFVASPRGEGEDCNRTWEALVLGCIPIVKASPLDPLYDGLPVLIVDKWEAITEERLKETVEKFSQMEFELEKLTLKYWVDRINDWLDPC